MNRPSPFLRSSRALAAFVLLALLGHALSDAARAEGEPPGGPARWLESVDARWGGHVKLRGGISDVDERSLYGLADAGAFWDGALEARLTNRTFFSDRFYGEAHYEVLVSGGDTRRARTELERRSPGPSSQASFLGTGVEDDRRFLDLTRTVHERDDHRITHRLDRLFLAYTAGRAAVRAGRQAVTWGNGLLFNPMDLVNPFSPSDIERDYKIGDDMISVRTPLFETGEAQAIYVPRRSQETGRVTWDRSSLAAKVHLARGALELDVLAAVHYGEEVFGLGATGYAGGAAWRLDATWTFLEREQDQDGFLSLTANLDYSWVWWDRNVYGFLELFYSGIGEHDPVTALSNEGLMDRVGRGELFTLGRAYLAGHINVEAHPLVNFFLTVIHRLNEPSGLVQPRVVWDVTRNLQVTAGANLPYGGTGTEFDGFPVPGTGRLTPAPDRGFVWGTYFF